MKEALDSADLLLDDWHLASVVGSMVLVRFFIGTACLTAVSSQARSGLRNPEAWRGGLVLGLLLWGGFLTQMLALDDISPAVSAFLTSLYVVFTALIGLYLRTHPLTSGLLIGVILATLGAGFIDGPPHLTWGWAELLTVFSAFLFAIHIIMTDSITKRVDPLQVTMTSFLVVVIASFITLIVVLLTAPAESPGVADLYGMLTSMDVLIWLILLGALGTFVALMLLNLNQRFLHPVHAAIIFAFEPVWATIYALIVDLNEFSMWLFVGGGALLVGNLIVETRERAHRENSLVCEE